MSALMMHYLRHKYGYSYWKILRILQIRRCSVRVRFAPSPTGHLHLGSLRTALYNHLYALCKNGTFVLRIEDTDQTRTVPGATEKLIDILKWSGIQPDEGPGIGGKYGPYIQSQRTDLYREQIERLLQNGTAYRCFCTTKRLELMKKDANRRGETPKYDNKCRHLSNQEVQDKLNNNQSYVVRFKLPSSDVRWEDMILGPVIINIAALEGDPVLMKSDNFPTYHFANVVDDHFMKITHVLRGIEWQVSTPKHLFLYQAFGWTPPHYGHLPLIKNKDGTKLSKRQGDIHVEHFKRLYYLPQSIVKYVTLVGGGFEGMSENDCDTIQDLANKFCVEKIKTHPACLDPEKLEMISKQYFYKNLEDNKDDTIKETREMVSQRLMDKYGNISTFEEVLSTEYIENILRWCKTEGRINKLGDLTKEEFLFVWTLPCEKDIQSVLKSNSIIHNDLINKTLQLLKSVGESNYESDFTLELRKLAKNEGLRVKPVFSLLRKVLTGLEDGPPVAQIVSVIGKEAAVKRLEKCFKILNSSSTSE